MSWASRSLHGERGLKLVAFGVLNHLMSRSLHGERGLKRADWRHPQSTSRRSLHGERGLKQFLPHIKRLKGASRSLHGERGLKLCQPTDRLAIEPSLPSRGAWIETSLKELADDGYLVAPFTGSVD